MAQEFMTLLKTHAPLLSDGAMGTMLHTRGIGFDECFDQLNLTQPAMVSEIHREYINAGSNIIQTNTFGANRYKLARYGLEDQVASINQAGVETARRAILASFKEVFIAGDVGPLGVRMAPFGRIQPEQVRQAYLEQASALAAAGIDLFVIETMTDLFELTEAISAARQAAPHLPILASMTFTRDDRTLLGDDPAKVAREFHKVGVEIIGVNCSGGPNQILQILKLMRQAVPDAYFSVMPNAGWPEQVSGRIMYPAMPEYFGEYALDFWRAGASVIGGCCGTTPLHIAYMSGAIQSANPAERSAEQLINGIEREEATPAVEQPTYLAQKLDAGQFIISVEMHPPRGLSSHKLQAGASLLTDTGADVINVADSPMARMRMSPWAVCDILQSKVGIETVLHFPTRGRNLLRVQGDLLAAHALGVRNVFVVMGDPTAIGDYPDAMDNYDLVPSGLIKLIKQGFNAGVDHSGTDIGQPTSFFVGCALNLTPQKYEDEIKNLHRKIKAGADFILTQPVYDPQVAQLFLERYTQTHGQITTPILMGVLPLVNARHASFLHNEVPGIFIPDAIMKRMEGAESGGAQQGIQIAIELIEQFASFVQGIYIMPQFSHYDHAAEIIESTRKRHPKKL